MEDTNKLISNGKLTNKGNGQNGIEKKIVGTFTEKPPRVTEQSLAGLFFLITILILIAKLAFMIKSSVHSALQWRYLVKAVWSDSATGQEFIKYYWKSGLHGQFLMWPLLCGSTAFVFTWLITYFDSRVPGIDPPMPNFLKTSLKSETHSLSSKWPIAYRTSILIGFLTFFILIISPKF